MSYDEDRTREMICRVGRSLFDRGYVHATAGNISVAVPAEAGGGYLITPTDACLGFLQPDTLARLDPDLSQVSGAKASKTIVLHRKIYEQTAGTAYPAGCVLHTHSTNCVALTLAMRQPVVSGCELLPPITPYFVMKVGHVPVIPYGVPGAETVAENVRSTIGVYDERGLPLRAVMLERLGPVVWGGDPMAAMAVLEEMEETARLVRQSGQDCKPLDDDALQALCEQFGVKW